MDQKLNGSDPPKPSTDEEDPCIQENQKSNHSVRNFRQRTEEKLRSKSGLSEKGLRIAFGIILLTFILFIVVISLAIAWPRLPHHKLVPVCQRSECLEASAQIQNALNSTVSPCTDTWSWACGGWVSKNPLPPDRSVWNRRQKLIVQERAKVRDLISTLPLSGLSKTGPGSFLSTDTVEWKMKHLYESCMEVENVDADGIRPLTRIITELGGWYIMREWSVHSWDYRRVLEKLHSEFAATPFFKVTIEPNPRQPGQNSIRIAPSGLGLPDRSFYYAENEDKVVNAYKTLIKDVIISFRATSVDAHKFSNDIFFYEKRIAEITPDAEFLRDPVKTHNPVTVSELKITAASLPLREILMAMFPKAGITDDTEVLVSSPDYLTAISGIVSSSDRSALNNYVIWTLVREFLPYLPTEYTLALHQYTSQLTGINAPLERWEMCSIMLQKFMGLATQSMLDKKEPISQKSSDIVNYIFKYVKNASLDHIRKAKFPLDLERHYLQKISTLTVQIGLPENTTNEKYLKNYYNSLYVQKSNLFQNIFNGFGFLRYLQQMQYLEAKKEDRYISFMVNDDPKCTYLPSLGTIIVPRTLILEPYFNENFPLSILYGRLGVEIARAVIESILPYQGSWIQERGVLTQYHSVVNQSEQITNEFRVCLDRFLINNGLASKEVAHLTSLETAKSLSAIKIAHTALRYALENVEHIHQPTLEIYEDSALFYISYSQELCSAYTPQYQHLENHVNFQLTQNEMLKVVWNQLDTFSSNFVCEKKQKEKCSDIL